MKKKIPKILFHTHTEHFWVTQYVQKYSIFFALTKEIFLQPLVEIIFRYHKIFLNVLGPPTNKMQKKKNFTYRVLGIKIG